MYGHNGGVWEWTSTPLEGYEGFVPSGLYPGYSADFFDGKHFVVVSYPLSRESSATRYVLTPMLDRWVVRYHSPDRIAKEFPELVSGQLRLLFHRRTSRL